MIQIVEMTEQEKYDMYMNLNKDELARMLIQSNNHLDLLNPIHVINTQPCTYYMAGNDTAMNCAICGKPKSSH